MKLILDIFETSTIDPYSSYYSFEHEDKEVAKIELFEIYTAWKKNYEFYHNEKDRLSKEWGEELRKNKEEKAEKLRKELIDLNEKYGYLYDGYEFYGHKLISNLDDENNWDIYSLDEFWEQFR